MDTRAAHALIRFGFGRAGGQPLPADPVQWLGLQLAGQDLAPTALQPDPGSAAAAITLFELDRTDPPPPGQPRRSGTLFRTETGALLQYALTTDAAFRERLVWFWANHFTISTRRGMVAPLAGSFVRDAIRPYVTGRFSSMVLAVMRHPAMLVYLDNAQSAGPNSQAGQRNRRGLNENLARECLELHTVTPAAGYTQTDVTEFARILTGWSIEVKEPPLGFKFRPFLAEPGEKRLLGRSFGEGQQGGVDALTFLGDHPMTHRALAVKLARHFITDQPPPEAVRAIEGALRDTRGNLASAYRAIIAQPAAWKPLQKLRSPFDLTLAAFRAGLPVSGIQAAAEGPLPGVMTALGQGLFNAVQPSGWPDVASEWIGPEAMMRRVDWAYGFANRPELPDPVQMADTALGPLLPDRTMADLRQAGSRREGMTLLLASPEFQRR